MITIEDIKEAEQHLVNEWGIQGEKVITEAHKYRDSKKFVGSTGDFLNHCVACGGNWGAMFLYGIKSLFPSVYEAIPFDMGDTGNEAFINIVYTMMLCGVDTSK